jgi:hypothetical protein
MGFVKFRNVVVLGRDAIEHAMALDIDRRSELLHSAGCRTRKCSSTAASTMRRNRIKRFFICRDVPHAVERATNE